MNKHSLLIIGCGSIGERHLRCFRHTNRVSVSVCDANSTILTKIGATYGIRVHADWQRTLAEEHPDAVVICTPAPSHVPVALAALRAGCHVLIEKPLSQSWAGVEELVAASACSPQQTAVAYVYHVYPVLIAARAYLLRGELGPILQMTLTSGQPFHRLRPAYAQTYYRDHKTGGGAIQDALTHAANWVESVLGPTDSLYCDADHLALPDVEVEDTVHLSARHGQVRVNYSLNQFQAPNETTLDFHAARGSVRIELHNQRWGVFREGDSTWTWHTSPVGDRDTPFLAQANAFLDQLEGSPSRLCSIEAAAQTLRFNLAALESVRRGARVNCQEVHA